MAWSNAFKATTSELESKPSWLSFLIELDLATEEKRENPFSAPNKTGNGEERVVPSFERWNYADAEELAKICTGTLKQSMSLYTGGRLCSVSRSLGQ